jgi:uncharacterized protein
MHDPLSSSVREHRKQRATRVKRVKWLLRRLPRRSNLHTYPVVRWFAEAARSRPYLWSFKPQQVRPAIYAGAVIAFLPVYGLQILLALWAAMLLRTNLAVTSALQFITNPLTAGPVYYFCYRIGRWLIDLTGAGEGLTSFGTRMNALVLGGIVVGLMVGFVVDMLYRFVLYDARVIKARHEAAVVRLAAAPRPAPAELRPLPAEPSHDREG